jgi:hypothetical protein
MALLSPAWKLTYGDTSMPRLLLIEDDLETADEIRAELSERGFDVDWAVFPKETAKP